MSPAQHVAAELRVPAPFLPATATSPSVIRAPLPARSVFIMALSCQIHPPPGEPSHNRIYPDKRCDRAPHLFILVFAVPFAALTITIGWLLAAGTTEMDPLNRELMAVPFPEASTKIFVAVTGIDVLSVFLRGHGRTFGVTTALLSGYILYVLLRWIPYYTRWVNRLMVRRRRIADSSAATRTARRAPCAWAVVAAPPPSRPSFLKSAGPSLRTRHCYEYLS